MTPVRLDDPPRNFREVALILHQIVTEIGEIKKELSAREDERNNARSLKISIIAGGFITFTSGVVTPLVVWAMTR